MPRPLQQKANAFRALLAGFALGVAVDSSAQIPSPRAEHTAVWTGTEMIVWGGKTSNGVLSTGARYNPNTGTWTPMNSVNAPAARTQHTAIWTGTEMIVFGGYDFTSYPNYTYLADGGRYDPVTDTWSSLMATGSPTTRGNHTAIWTGSRMYVYAGASNSIATGEVYLNSGGGYSPSGKNWQTTTLTGVPLPREGHTAVWTGTEMLVFAGITFDGTNPVKDNDGARYNPVTDSWLAMATNNAPTNRTEHTAVWTGSRMIAWGGLGNGANDFLNSGGVYNPAANSWLPTSMTNAPTIRQLHTAVWTGTEMIVWGGRAAGNFRNTGGRYNPSGDAWNSVTTANAPAARANHSAVWTGTEMLVWGGQLDPTNFTSSLGRYRPSIDAWDAPPQCSLGSPANGASLPGGVGILLSASASDSDGSVAQVDFFADAAMVGSRLLATNSVYTLTWTNPSVGAHVLTVVATDNLGAKSTSAPVSVTINSPVPPVVTLNNPASNTVFPEFSNISVAAGASDPDGMVARVDFFADTTLIGTSTNFPFVTVWSNVAHGVYSLSSRALDNSGLMTTSAPVDIIVNALPTVAMTNPAVSAMYLYGNAVTVGASAADVDGSVSQVQFFIDGSPAGTTASVPYKTTWSNQTLGFHTFTAIATDNRGMSRTSPPVTIESVLKPNLAVANLLTQYNVFLSGGQTNRTYRIDVSPDLASWAPLATNVASNGTLLIFDVPPSNTVKRFYRANP